MNYKPKNKQWFLDRIGKRIFRDYYKCCNECDKKYKEGLIIADETHADYLHNIDHDFALEKIYLNYRDTK